MFWEKKNASDEIRKRSREEWTVNDIGTLLTYKRQKDDPPAIRRNKKNRQSMLDEWDRRSHCPTPACSPISVTKQNKSGDESDENENETDLKFLHEIVPDSLTVEFEI